VTDESEIERNHRRPFLGSAYIISTIGNRSGVEDATVMILSLDVPKNDFGLGLINRAKPSWSLALG
jgi:hypothetical protein